MNDKSPLRSPRVIIQLLMFIVVIPLLPLLLARRRDWREARIYALITIGGFFLSRALVARRHPDLLAERARMNDHTDAEPWDKALAPLVGIGGGLIPLTAGLERRFGARRTFSMPAKIVSLVLILASYALSSWALVENRFFSSMVRIQTDREQHVVTSGPYRWLRHPGYAGALLTYLATPLFLDSVWALVPALFLSDVLVLRAHLEDRTLQEKLPGYSDYAQRVRYRLLLGL